MVEKLNIINSRGNAQQNYTEKSHAVVSYYGNCREKYCQQSREKGTEILLAVM